MDGSTGRFRDYDGSSRCVVLLCSDCDGGICLVSSAQLSSALLLPLVVLHNIFVHFIFIPNSLQLVTLSTPQCLMPAEPRAFIAATHLLELLK